MVRVSAAPRDEDEVRGRAASSGRRAAGVGGVWATISIECAETAEHTFLEKMVHNWSEIEFPCHVGPATQGTQWPPSTSPAGVAGVASGALFDLRLTILVFLQKQLLVMGSGSPSISGPCQGQLDIRWSNKILKVSERAFVEHVSSTCVPIGRGGTGRGSILSQAAPPLRHVHRCAPRVQPHPLHSIAWPPG